MRKAILFFIILTFLTFIYLGFEQMNAVYATNHEDEISDQLKENSLSKNTVYNDSYGKILNYYEVYNEWSDLRVTEGNDTHIIDPTEMSGGIEFLSVNSFDYGKNVLYLEPNTEVTFHITIEDEGLYQLYFDYYVLDQTRLTPNMSIEINQEYQYSEMNNIGLNVDWKIENEPHYDRYGDELTPKSLIDTKWYQDKGLIDPNYFFIEPLKFYLNQGENEIKITLNEGYLLLGDIKVENKYNQVQEYAQYKKQFSSSIESLNEKIEIEAEDILLKSRQSIRAKYMRDPNVTPYEYKNRVLNVLDGYSYGESGDRVTYSFIVEESGFYNLAIKYYLNTNNGLPSNRRILIDGEVPFKELSSYSFNYTSSWKNEVLKDESGEPFNIYLEEGIHTISLAVDNVLIRDVYHELLSILNDMQDISKDINKITGGLEDKERNWKITTYIPDLEDKLINLSNQLDQCIDDLIDYTKNENVPAITELKIAKDLIDEFVEDPEELPSYMNKFTKGENSAYGRINKILPTFIYNPLHMDKIYLYNDVSLPKANANIFVKFIEGVKAFFYSFFDPKYNETAEVDEDTIEIWVNKSRLYVEIMQRMIDEEFTEETGIKVQLSIMPDENKIILSNAAGSTPDGVIGISFQKPFELAIRDVTEDLRQYEGFYELANEFNPSTFVPYIYNEGVYAMPETQDVKLLFYRKDVLSQLGVEPPQTWDEVISLVPVLQKYDMNFYAPIGEENSYKGFDKTTPFIYQYGGDLYNNETMTTSINREGAYEAFEIMTDLFTVYNLPVTTSNFFQHFRSGIIPVGIGDANMYIQLKYAAPELAGQWGIMPIPGVMNEQDVIERWDPTYGTSSIIFKDSNKKDKTWELIKWWSKKETQADFSYNIQSTLGNKFLYMSANIEAFKMSAWPSDSKDVVLAQWEWIQATGKVPGDYMLERELSNAWNKVVFDGVNPRIAIDEAKAIIDRELERKLIEFDYMDEYGNVIRPYKIPTIYNIEDWVRKDEEHTE